jgi:hypothetical protein
MHIRKVSLWALATVVAAPLVSAQEMPTTYVFGTYYRCSEAKEARADAIFKETMAPILDKEVKAGHLLTYGWSRHWMGGDWRRLEYFIGKDIATMVDARDAYIAELMKDHATATDEFGGICPSHDDYVWTTGATSQTPESVGRSRPPVGASTYFQCDSNEDEADAIVKSAFAPVMNQHVKDGKIASWTWLKHVVGGKYRRALVMDGASHKALLDYWMALNPALEKAAPEMSERFSAICSSHSDYIWDVSSK